MAIIVNGYRTKENLGVSGFETIMRKIKAAIEEKQRKLYVELLSEEVNIVADCHILNCFNINKGYSIMDVAMDRVGQRIDEANRTKASTRYNFIVMLEIMPFRKRWYFNIVSWNEQLYTGILDAVKDLEKYVVEDGEDACTEDQQKVWEEISEIYKDKNQPLHQTYNISLPVKVSPEDIKIQPVQDRAVYQAESQEYCLIFQALTNGRTIQPIELMRYVDEVAIERNNSVHGLSVQKKISQLLVTLPELTPEMISTPVEALFAEQKPDDAIEQIEDRENPEDPR